MLLQLLPHLLRQQGRSAYAIFCDFRKAYDTVGRGFLLRIMEHLGIGPGFLAWAWLLLRDTRSKALVNGPVGAAFEAGVRQGLSLPPLLYLFIGQALLCFLKARGVGIDILVAGLRLSGVQLLMTCRHFWDRWRPQPSSQQYTPSERPPGRS